MNRFTPDRGAWAIENAAVLLRALEGVVSRLF
jgi:hypothetical protein